MLFVLLVVLFCLLIAAAHGEGALRRESNSFHNRAGYVDSNGDALHQLEKYLFPNKTVMRQAVSRRRLAISKPAYVADDVACSFCPADKMKYCRILSGLMVQETYLPKDTSKKEICTVLEALGARLSGEIFGNGRAFRDSADCRNMVMQYVCLFYGSDSSQYRNYCVYKEVVTNVGLDDQQKAPRAPCRSFCVQVATVCANDPTFIQTCSRIPCPPTGNTTCVPDPLMGSEDQTLATNLGCDSPFYRTPYNSATSLYPLSSLILCVVSGLVAFLMW